MYVANSKLCAIAANTIEIAWHVAIDSNCMKCGKKYTVMAYSNIYIHIQLAFMYAIIAHDIQQRNSKLWHASAILYVT